MILLDTSGLLALLDAGEPTHRQALAAISGKHPLMVTDLILAETDYLVLKRLGVKAEQELLDQILEGAFLREPISVDDLRRAREIVKRYADAAVGLTDATAMAVAERLSIEEVLTLDRRHFSPFRTRKGRALELLPAT